MMLATCALRLNRPSCVPGPPPGSVAGTKSGALTQFGRPEIPSPSVSAESALARMTASGIASIRPAPNTGGGSLTETSTAEGSRSGSAPAMAFSWSCGPPTSSAGSLPRLNRVRAF